MKEGVEDPVMGLDGVRLAAPFLEVAQVGEAVLASYFINGAIGTYNFNEEEQLSLNVPAMTLARTFKRLPVHVVGERDVEGGLRGENVRACHRLPFGYSKGPRS